MENEKKMLQVHQGKKSYPIEFGDQEQVTIMNEFDGNGLIAAPGLPNAEDPDIRFVDVIISELDYRPTQKELESTYFEGGLDTNALTNVPVVLRFRTVQEIDRFIDLLQMQKINLTELSNIANENERS